MDEVYLQDIKVILPDGTELTFTNFAEWKCFSAKLKYKEKKDE